MAIEVDTSLERYRALAGLDGHEISRVDPEVSERARKRILPILHLRHGEPEIYAPQSVLTLDEPGIIITNHRHMLDIPLSIEATEAVGLNDARMIGKVSLFSKFKWFTNWLEANGGYPVDRDDPNLLGLMTLGLALLRDDQNLLYYVEGTRVDYDVLNIAQVNEGALILAALSGAPLIPNTIAGVAKQRRDKSEEPRGPVTYKDKCAPFGMQGKVVSVFGDPIHLEIDRTELPVFEGYPERLRDLVKYTRAAREFVPEVHGVMQQLLDYAYKMRKNPFIDRRLPNGTEVDRVRSIYY